LRFKYYFNNLKQKDKILAFLLVPLILVFAFFKIEEYFIPHNKKHIDDKIKIIKLAIKNLKYKKNEISNIKTIKYIEDVADYLQIKVVHIKVDKKSFDIHTIGSYNNTINFISNLENSMKIISLKINKDDNQSIFMQGVFAVKNLNVKTNIKLLENLPNPFYEKRKYSHNKELNLVAIIGNEVCINDKWYVKNNLIGKYKLKTIFKDYVELDYKNKIIKLRISKNDN